MYKQMKLATAAGILGLFLVINYVFEFLSKIGAGIFSAVLTGQLTQEAWTSELFTAIWTQSLPFLVMIAIGAVLLVWANGKDSALEAADPEWAATAPLRKATKLATVGGLLAFAGLYNLAVPIYFGFGDLMAGLSSPESSGYVLKAVLPNYVVLLIQIGLGLWLMLGRKEPEMAVPAATVYVAPALPADGDVPMDAIYTEVPADTEPVEVQQAETDVRKNDH